MTPLPAAPRRVWFRFSLRTLMAGVTVAACIAGVVQYVPQLTWGMAGFALMLVALGVWILLLLKTCPTSRQDLPDSRRALRSRRFWRAFSITLPFTSLLTFVSYWQTYRAFQFDGYECYGWPVPFYRRGQYSPGLEIEGLVIDIVVGVGISLAAGLVMRKGQRGVKARFAKFFAGRT